MPRSGGDSGKLGNRYEGIWTVDAILDLLTGDALSVKVEPIGDESIGIEFICTRPDRVREFHSVKRQTSDPSWTIAALSRPFRSTGRSTLGDLFVKLGAEGTARAVFVSGTGANDLRELAEAAKSSSDSDIFQKRLSAKLGSHLTRHVLPLCEGQADRACRMLQRLDVRLICEQELRDRVEQKVRFIMHRCDGARCNPGDVRRFLAEKISDCHASPIDSDIVQRWLAAEGYERRAWARDRSLLDRIALVNETYQKHVQLELVNRRAIPRSEAPDICDQLLAPDGPKAIMVVGPAGQGKSCVLAQAAAVLGDGAIPHICVRLDASPDAARPHDLTPSLGESPVIVLAGLADGQPCALIVDQLDALSLVSGRGGNLWSVFETLLQEAQAYPNMRLVLGCRAFDLEHDHRLRRLADGDGIAKRVDLTPLAIDIVEAAIREASLDPKALRPSEVELLRTPLHLSIYLEAPPQPGETFDSVQELYSRYWDHKSALANQRAQRPVRWNAVIDRLAQEMSAQESLAVPRDILDSDDLASDAQVMASEHVLVLENDNYRFFHEGFFDYAYARRFVAQRKTLLDLLSAPDEEQHLFRRAQVRQILAYQRATRFDAYLDDLRFLLHDPEVRFHIKGHVFQWLSALDAPTAQEWPILAHLVQDNRYRRHALGVIRNRPHWFDVLDKAGVWNEWLSSADRQIGDDAIILLSSSDVMRQRSERIAELLRPYREHADHWTHRFCHMMSWGGIHDSRQMFDLFLHLIDNGTLDQARGPVAVNADWWSLLHQTSSDRPDLAAEAIGHWLDRACVLGEREGKGGAFDDRRSSSQFVGLIVNEAAKGSPDAFVRHLLPRIAALPRKTARTRPDGRIADTTWYPRPIGHVLNARDAITQGTITAMTTLAAQNPEALDRLTAEIESSPLETLAYFFLTAWAANPARYADRAMGYVLAQPPVLFMDIAPVVLAPFTSKCSPDALAKIESAIIGIATPWERQTLGYRGRRELALLQAVSEQRIGPTARARRDELERKFPGAVFEPPRPVMPTQVASPISADRASHMQNRNWLSAMRKHRPDRPLNHAEAETGSARELSNLLESMVAGDPQRFALLGLEMGDDIAPMYFDAILRGIAAAHPDPNAETAHPEAQSKPLPTEVIVRVLRRAHALPGHPCGRWICHLLQKTAHCDFPADILSIAAHYATLDADPKYEAWQSPHGENDVAEYGGDPHTNGLNTVRGGAALAIAELLYGDGKRLAVLEPAIVSLANDPSLAVRSCAAEALLAMLRLDTERAVSLFRQLAENADPSLATPPVDWFLHYAVWNHYLGVRPILQQMLTSSNEGAVKVGARQTCVAALTNPEAGQDAVGVATGSDTMRLAAAEVYATNIADETVSGKCRDELLPLFRDPSLEVRRQASHCFLHLGSRALSEYVDLIEAFIASPAYTDQPDGLLRALEESTEHLPDIVLRAAQTAIESIGPDGGNIQSRSFGDAATIATLVVRLYHQSRDDEIKVKCLDRMDRMEESLFYGIREELTKLDR